MMEFPEEKGESPDSALMCLITYSHIKASNGAWNPGVGLWAFLVPVEMG